VFEENEALKVGQYIEREKYEIWREKKKQINKSKLSVLLK
jgi:hypothetical protein